MAQRDDLRIGKVFKKDLIRYYKKTMQTQWFDEFSSNSIVLFKKMRNQEEPKSLFYDLSTETKSVYDWINDSSMEPLEELSGGSYKIGDLIKKPMFLAFMNREHPEYGKASIELYNTLTKIAPLYPQFIFMFTEETNNESKKRYLGITWKEEVSCTIYFSRNHVFKIKPLVLHELNNWNQSFILILYRFYQVI